MTPTWLYWDRRRAVRNTVLLVIGIAIGATLAIGMRL